MVDEGMTLVSQGNTGVIKKFFEESSNRSGGFGFIVADAALGRDVFFHITDVAGYPERKTVPVDAKVSYDLFEHPKGFRARKVTLA